MKTVNTVRRFFMSVGVLVALLIVAVGLISARYIPGSDSPSKDTHTVYVAKVITHALTLDDIGKSDIVQPITTIIYLNEAEYMSLERDEEVLIDVVHQEINTALATSVRARVIDIYSYEAPNCED
jgi:predicted DNA-binding ArsR family transcriptional regulator